MANEHFRNLSCSVIKTHYDDGDDDDDGRPLGHACRPKFIATYNIRSPKLRKKSTLFTSHFRSPQAVDIGFMRSVVAVVDSLYCLMEFSLTSDK